MKIIKTVTLRLSDEKHKEVKLLTVNEGITIQDYITKLIDEDLEKREKDNQA